MIDVREYLDSRGRSPFAKWFHDLNAEAAAKVTTVVTRISLGNFSNVKGVGSGVFEYKLDFGPGYRIYFGKDGEALVILLVGRKGASNATSKPLLRTGRITNEESGRVECRLLEISKKPYALASSVIPDSAKNCFANPSKPCSPAT